MFDFNIMALMVYLALVKYIFGIKWSWENPSKAKPNRVKSLPKPIVKDISYNPPPIGGPVPPPMFTSTKTTIITKPKRIKKPLNMSTKKGKING